MTLITWSITLKIIQLVKHLLEEIRKVETKNKHLINGQKILLSLFDDLIKAIFNNKSVSNIDDTVSVNESENESVNENENVSKNESVDKTDDVDTNNYFNIIDKTKSFEDQIEILKKWMI